MNEETRRLWINSNEAIKRHAIAEYSSRAEAKAEQGMIRAKAEFEEHLNRLCNNQSTSEPESPNCIGPSD